ncbi:MAG: hypothetical protein ACHQQQ_06880 [Bacteroidota bacterium]
MHVGKKYISDRWRTIRARKRKINLWKNASNSIRSAVPESVYVYEELLENAN